MSHKEAKPKWTNQIKTRLKVNKMKNSINWTARHNAAEKRLNSNPADISMQIRTKPASHWAGLTKVNGRRQAMANARAYFDLAHYCLTKGLPLMARMMLDKGRAELEAAKVLARIC